MKKQPPTAFSEEIWREIEMIFWRNELSCMQRGCASDGIIPLTIEATKHGVEIVGEVWFLPGGSGSPNSKYELSLCLSRPEFPSIESVTADKLSQSDIIDSSLEDSILYVTVQYKKKENKAEMATPNQPSD